MLHDIGHMNLIIFGPQGSGKGTQADLLAHKYSLAHIETGQIFRDIAREPSELGRLVKDLNDRKEMIPDEITSKVIEEHVRKVPSAMGVILDSAPRTMGQIAPVEEMLSLLKREVAKAIYIKLPYNISVERITKRYICPLCRRHFVLGRDIARVDDPCPTCGGPIRQRLDDTPEGVAKRLKTFYEVTVPVIEHYRLKGMLVEVDGDQPVEKVFEDIVAKLQD